MTLRYQYLYNEYLCRAFFRYTFRKLLFLTSPLLIPAFHYLTLGLLHVSETGQEEEGDQPDPREEEAAEGKRTE